MNLFVKEGDHFVEFNAMVHEKAGTFVMLKGTSGTGKGTRTRQVIEFLRTQEEPIELFTDFENAEKPGQKYEVGLLFPKLGLVFVGKYTTSNKRSKLVSWTSLDFTHRINLNVIKTGDLLQELLKNYAVLAEGNPLITSFRYRVKHLVQERGVKKYFVRYYLYGDDKQEYLNRIIGRSGQAPKGDAAWLNNPAFHRNFELDTAEAEEVDIVTDMKECEFDEDPTVFGTELLEFLDAEGKEKFPAFCTTYSSLRKYEDVSKL